MLAVIARNSHRAVVSAGSAGRENSVAEPVAADRDWSRSRHSAYNPIVIEHMFDYNGQHAGFRALCRAPLLVELLVP